MAQVIEVLDDLPDGVREYLAPFEDAYSAAIDREKGEHFVVIAGKAGAGKSTLINAVAGTFKMLSCSGSSISHTMVPTKIKNGPAGQKLFSVRIVHAVHDLSWHKTRMKAIERLKLALATVSKREGNPLMTILKDTSLLNVLRSVYPALHPNAEAMVKWSEKYLPGTLQRGDLAAKDVFDRLQKDDNEFEGVRFFATSKHSEQTFVDLTSEHASLLLTLAGTDYQSDIEVLQLLVCRFLLVNPNAQLDASLDQLISECQLKDPKIDDERLWNVFGHARSLGEHFAATKQKFVFPKDLLNLWPLIAYLEVSGPFKLPPRVVLVDSAGSQDRSQINDPLKAAKNSTQVDNPRLWYLVENKRLFSNDHVFEEVPKIGHLFNWDQVSIVAAMSEQSSTHEDVSRQVQMRIAAELKDSDEKAKSVQVYITSSIAFMALHDDQCKDDIAKSKFRVYEKRLVSSGIEDLRKSLDDWEDSKTSIEKLYAEKLFHILNFTQTLNTTSAAEDLSTLSDDFKQLYNHSNGSDVPQTLARALNDHKRTMHVRFDSLREAKFKDELGLALKAELGNIKFYKQLCSLVSGQGNLDLYARNADQTSKQYHLAEWFGAFADKFAIHSPLSSKFAEVILAEFQVFVTKAKELLSKMNCTSPSFSFRLTELNRVLDYAAGLQESDLQRHVKLPPPTSIAGVLENRGDLRDEYVTMWSKVPPFPRTGMAGNVQFLCNYLADAVPQILYRTNLRIQNEHDNELYGAYLFAARSILKNIKKEWKLVMKFEASSLHIDETKFHDLMQQLGTINTTLPSNEHAKLSAPLEFIAKKRKLEPCTEEKQSVLGDGTFVETENETDPRMIQIEGKRYLFLFRGLCAAFTDVTHFQGSNVESSMGNSIQHALRDKKYYGSSGFVMVEHYLREKSEMKNNDLEALGKEVSVDVIACARKNFDYLLQSIGTPVDPPCKSLAYFNSKFTKFENFRYATQQIYSNDDEKFMGAYADVAHDVRRTAQDTELNITALSERENALFESLRSQKRYDYLKLEAWSWLGNVKYLLPRHSAAQYLHGNPFVSLTDDLEHALRYATGQKKYMQGKEQQRALDLPYGLNEKTGKYEYDLTFCVPKSMEGLWLGVLILVLIPEDVYKMSCKDGFCNNVSGLHGDKILIKHRILFEREVTFLGCLPKDAVVESWPIPLLSLSLTDNKAEWLKYYNIASENEACFETFKQCVDSLVKARVLKQSTFNLNLRARAALADCLIRKIRLDLHNSYPKMTRAELFGNKNDRKSMRH